MGSEAFRRELRPVAGAGALVEWLRSQAIATCVASQGALAKIKLSLELTGLDALFPEEVRFSAEQVRRGKPFPDLFLHAARVLEAEPAGCVVIEDTPSGAAAAVAAGMRVLGYAADSDSQALAQAGAEIVMSLGEVRARLD